MDKMLIQGGNELQGEVTVGGSKNATLPLMAATLLTTGVNCIHNVPLLQDVRTMLRLLNSLGAKTSFDEEKKLCMIDTSNLTSFTASYDLVKTMRSSILVLGPLLAKYKQAKVSMPGGCAIGARPVDFHLQGLEKFGCQIEIERGDIVASFKQSENTTFTFPRRSVTGTENLIMAACLGNSAITLDNCAKEPHVTELAIALNAMGAKISGAGTDTIVIEGVDELKPMDHTVHPDYIEAGTFLIAGAITKGDMIIHQFPFDYLSRFVEMMHEMGVHVEMILGLILQVEKTPAARCLGV